MSRPPILSAESIGKSYHRRRVLTSAGLWATPGRIAAVFGRNGSGKSTLVRIAAGWVRPDYGVVIYRGERSLRPKAWALARAGLYYLPERGVLSRGGLTVREHLDALAHHFDHVDVRRAVKRLRLAEFLDRKPRTLSGGERRRAELCLAIARNPVCLIADEPFLGIMPKDAEIVSAALQHLARKGCAVVATGHEIGPLMQLCGDVFWQTSGTTHFLGTPSDAQAHDQFRREYLGGSFRVSDGAP